MATTSPSSVSLQHFNPLKTSFPYSSPSKPHTEVTQLHIFFRTRTLTKAQAQTQAQQGLEGIGEVAYQIKRLQNGSDIRGVALEGEKGRAVDLTPQAVHAIAESFGDWVIEGLGCTGERRSGGLGRISVGRDPRISGPTLSVAVFAGLGLAGCSAFDMGLATTPACYMSTLLPSFAYDASIMVGAATVTRFLVVELQVG